MYIFFLGASKKNLTISKLPHSHANNKNDLLTLPKLKILKFSNILQSLK